MPFIYFIYTNQTWIWLAKLLTMVPKLSLCISFAKAVLLHLILSSNPYKTWPDDKQIYWANFTQFMQRSLYNSYKLTCPLFNIFRVIGHAICVKTKNDLKPALTEKRVPKQYPWGAIATNSTLFFQRGAFFPYWGTKTVPLAAPNYGQQNSTPRGAVSAPFFSEWVSIWPEIVDLLQSFQFHMFRL